MKKVLFNSIIYFLFICFDGISQELLENKTQISPGDEIKSVIIHPKLLKELESIVNQITENNSYYEFFIVNFYEDKNERLVMISYGPEISNPYLIDNNFIGFKKHKDVYIYFYNTLPEDTINKFINLFELNTNIQELTEQVIEDLITISDPWVYFYKIEEPDKLIFKEKRRA